MRFGLVEVTPFVAWLDRLVVLVFLGLGVLVVERVPFLVVVLARLR